MPKYTIFYLSFQKKPNRNYHNQNSVVLTDKIQKIRKASTTNCYDI
jgi:hypothetical protein